MTASVSAPVYISPIQVQAMVHQIRQEAIENISKILMTKKPQLNHALPGTGTRGFINLRV